MLTERWYKHSEGRVSQLSRIVGLVIDYLATTAHQTYLMSSTVKTTAHHHVKQQLVYNCRNCTEYFTFLASKPEMRSQIVPQEFKGNAYVVTEHQAVLHADGVVGILRILVHQALKDPQFH